MNRSAILLACAFLAIVPRVADCQSIGGKSTCPAELTGGGPDPIFEKPAPLSMAELAKRTTDGVSAVEVHDYMIGNYHGALKPSPPHADLNPNKAVVVFWKDHSQRFVFSHEASYCPWLELPNGAGMSNQFFEGMPFELLPRDYSLFWLKE